MSGLFDTYTPTEAAFDEMFSRKGAVRRSYEGVHRQMQLLRPEEVRSRADYLASTYVEQGVTFDIGGEERPFPLDLVPRIIPAKVWKTVEAGVAQRVKTLEAFLDDVYGAGMVFRDGVMPRNVVTSSPHFHRVVAGIIPNNGVRVHVSGIDLIRDNAGTFRVLEDNARIPSGVSYVLTNRRSISTALPEVLTSYRIRPVGRYPQKLLAALRACAPSGVTDPTVVVLTPGVHNSAYFEHALLARLMGCRLVEGRDLVAQSGRVMIRTTHGLHPVHVIYRRVDDDFLDPVYFRKDSMLGAAGIVNAVRARNVTIANAIGNGVSDDKLVYTYMPDLVRYYLGQEPILPNVDTWRLEEPEHRAEVLDRLDELVLKPVDGSGGKGIVIGPQASRAELDAIRARVIADPRGWIAQPVVQLSTVPTYAGGAASPRHVDLRPFAVHDGSSVWVLPGGLTRVALKEGELIVNSSRGGGSKDTWVIADATNGGIDDDGTDEVVVTPEPPAAVAQQPEQSAQPEQPKPTAPQPGPSKPEPPAAAVAGAAAHSVQHSEAREPEEGQQQQQQQQQQMFGGRAC